MTALSCPLGGQPQPPNLLRVLPQQRGLKIENCRNILKGNPLPKQQSRIPWAQGAAKAKPGATLPSFEGVPKKGGRAREKGGDGNSEPKASEETALEGPRAGAPRETPKRTKGHHQRRRPKEPHRGNPEGDPQGHRDAQRQN